ncbi:MAG: bifunctional 4-hydroxy-2-oxoglutarate aldolase/2-dehydro-3-deoxy-phosphogluconate aldolase [Lachnospiraceae bacterium]|nr:bifunctional 4-hydroxy-2-oxoglutarate aldolase/2-dehydro-3-deoxy-phosphogluconate aldolase [Lachnospiraceae bacterium]
MKEILKDNPICAIMRGIPTEKALAYAQAAYRGGVRLFEVAMNTQGGAEQIALLRREFGADVYIGAGTVINKERCKAAHDAGAQFFLTPNAAKETLRYCRSHEIPLLPGVMTPTDVGVCLDYGFQIMKLFPAGDLPMSYIKSLKGPFDGTQYVAVGGVKLENIAGFFKAGFIGVGIGSNLIPKEFVKNDDWDSAAAYVKKFFEQIETVE